MFTIEKAVLDEGTKKRLIELSEEWAAEGITFGLRANTEEDLKEPCFVAVSEGGIIGYTFGHFYVKEEKTSVIDVGSRCFEVDELYVSPAFRSMGAGRALYKAIEEEAYREADFVTLVTATKDWRRILKFYADDMGMVFHDAYLVKGKKE